MPRHLCENPNWRTTGAQISEGDTTCFCQSVSVENLLVPDILVSVRRLVVEIEHPAVGMRTSDVVLGLPNFLVVMDTTLCGKIFLIPSSQKHEHCWVHWQDVLQTV